ncbi:MAG: hypothetical protein HYZ54_13050 [Ignavibacteriae bacterium]|nr:hypothetical protein [Ignavibacteriota bacterium]
MEQSSIDLLTKNGFSIAMVIVNAIITFISFRRSEKYKSQLSKDVENYKLSLSKDLEEHKSELSKISQEHQTKFSHYYSERAEVMKNICSQAYDLEQALRECFQNPSGKNPHEVLMSLIELKSTISKNRIYFSEDICSNLNDITKKIGDTIALSTSLVETSNIEGLPRSQQHNTNTRHEIFNTIEETLPNIRKKIEKEFRILLGVEK